MSLWFAWSSCTRKEGRKEEGSLHHSSRTKTDSLHANSQAILGLTSDSQLYRIKILHHYQIATVDSKVFNLCEIYVLQDCRLIAELKGLHSTCFGVWEPWFYLGKRRASGLLRTGSPVLFASFD